MGFEIRRIVEFFVVLHRLFKFVEYRDETWIKPAGLRLVPALGLHKRLRSNLKRQIVRKSLMFGVLLIRINWLWRQDELVGVKWLRLDILRRAGRLRNRKINGVVFGGLGAIVRST